MSEINRYKCVLLLHIDGAYKENILWGNNIDKLCDLCQGKPGFTSLKIYDYNYQGIMIVNWWK